MIPVKKINYFVMTKNIIKVYFTLAFVSLLLASCASNGVKTAGKLAPKPEALSEAVIQVYAARTLGAKKAVSVHTWISIKPENNENYTSYEIIGWRLARRGTALVERTNRPDRDWWGNQPELLLDIRGSKAEKLIPKVIAAVKQYPFANNYHAWPGPNSNTFTAFIGKNVPELGLDLPSTAIGKDYRELHNIVGYSPSGTGVQASLWGLLSLTLGKEEGLEVNLLGLNFELDLFDLAIELPGIGRIGPSVIKDNSFADDLLEENLSSNDTQNSSAQNSESTKSKSESP